VIAGPADRRREPNGPEVMIVNAPADEAAATLMCDRIEDAGIDCWIASRDVLGGENLPQAVSKALSTVRALVLALSSSANTDNRARRIVQLAHDRGVALIPVRIEDVVPSSALAFFIGSPNRHNWITFGAPPSAADFDALVDAVRSHLGVPKGQVVLRDVPLQARVEHAPSIGLVGRAQELAAIDDRYKRFSEGNSVEIVFVSGEPGVGKTTITSEVARRAFGSGACVLFGHCDEDVGFPYQPFAEALDHLVAHAPEEFLVDHIEKYGSEIERLVPSLGRNLGSLPPSKSTDAETERFLLFASTLGLFGAAAALQPVVLVLDDLQWADRSSLQMLRQVAQAAQPIHMFVLGTYRDAELSSSHPLVDTLGALRRAPGLTKVELKGLDDGGVLAFMEAAAGQELDEDGVALAHAVYRETDGNPFFVGELLRHLADTGTISRDEDGRWSAKKGVGAISLPESVREVVGARAARLGEDARNVLSLASVIGRDFDLDLLERVAQRPEGELLDILESAVGADLVREVPGVPGRYAFTHALVQHTLYEDLGHTRRSRAHRAAGEALEEMLGDDPSERVGDLAYHWFSALRPVDVKKAADYSRRAAEAALASLAPDDAERYFDQALDLHRQQPTRDPHDEIELLVGKGTAQRQSGDPGFRETLLDAAQRALAIGATERLVAAALANNRGLFSSLGQVDEQRAEVLQQAIGSMPDSDSNERALLLATLCNEYTYGKTFEERLDLARQAKAMARRLGDPSTRLRVICLVEQPIEVLSTLEERVADTTEALSLAAELDDPVLLYFANVYRRITAMQEADFATSATCLGEMQGLNDRIGQPILQWITAFHEAAEALTVGDTAAAETSALAALQVGSDSGQPDAVVFFGSQMVIVRHQQGRLGEFLPTIRGVAEQVSEMPHFLGGVAASLLDAGERDEALRLLESAAADRFGSLSLGFGWTEGICGYSEVAIEMEAIDPAGMLFDMLKPYDRQIPFNGLMPFEPISMWLGSLATVIGRYEDAERYLEEATGSNSLGMRRFAQARTDLARGRLLAAKGDDLQARQMLESARSSATENGYAAVERRAAAALSKLT
jgi:tetratricopeptide (TPR) repeat protein